MVDIRETVKSVVRWYAGSGRGLNTRVFPALDDENQVYAVMDVLYPVRDDVAGVIVLVRIVGDKVVIEEDTTNRPIRDRLIEEGIPRENIVLVYAGEPIPDPERYAL